MPLDQAILLHELEPTVEKEVTRHLSAAREWFPHEYVPYSDGRTYSGPLGGESWEPGDSKVSPESRDALLVNLLTEDNLPGYHRQIATIFGLDDPWGFWVNRWTAEENRHSIVIRDYLHVTRAIDPCMLERARMQQMQKGYRADHHADSVLHGLGYVAFQELGTRISHRNTGIASGDPICEGMMARVAADENLHMLFYRNVLGAAFDLVPDQAMCAVADVVKNFRMPGHSIDGYLLKAVMIANAGIYDLRIHRDDVIAPIIREWKIMERTDLAGEGEKAREELAAFMTSLDEAATRFEARREIYRATRPGTAIPGLLMP
jgi:acyl-[acyl-carrier-protein] desaturase